MMATYDDADFKAMAWAIENKAKIKDAALVKFVEHVEKLLAEAQEEEAAKVIMVN